jgi:hypothetical protein
LIFFLATAIVRLVEMTRCPRATAFLASHLPSQPLGRQSLRAQLLTNRQGGSGLSDSLTILRRQSHRNTGFAPQEIPNESSELTFPQEG